MTITSWKPVTRAISDPFLSLHSVFFHQVSLSGSMLDVYGGEQGMNAAKGGMSPTSNPSKLTVKREYTGMSL